MPTKKVEVPSPSPNVEALTKARLDGTRLVATMRPIINTLTVKTEQDYITADTYLTQVREKRRAWKDRMAEVLDPLKASVAAAKKAHKAADDLYDEIDAPWAGMESSIKQLMAGYKLEEQRQIAAVAAARAIEIDKLEREAADKLAAEAKARTPAMAVKIMESRARLQQSLADKRAEVAPTGIKAAGSTPRTLKKWRVVSLARFIMSLITPRSFTGTLNEELLPLVTIDKQQMDAKFALDRPEVGEWMPGIECYEEVIIAGRRL